MPGTVKFREAIKQDDGTYKPGDVISDCKWTYDSQEASNEWEYSSKTINAIVPDGKAIMLTYTYSVKGDLLQEYNDSNLNLMYLMPFHWKVLIIVKQILTLN